MKSTKTENVLWVNVHQVQTISPEKFKTKDITFEQAKTYDTEEFDSQTFLEEK